MGLIILCSSLVFADEITLKNGEIVEGNIINVDTDGNIKIDIVLDNQITGMIMVFKKDEIGSHKIDDKFRTLKKRELTEEEKLVNTKLLERQQRAAADVDYKIRKRVEREKNRIKDIEMRYEDKRRFEKQLEHEKEVTQMQKELLKESVNSGVQPRVDIINTNKKSDFNLFKLDY